MPAWFAGRLALLLFAAGAVYLVGNDRVGLWDRDEPRYAQTSRQMLLSDPPDWIVPRLYDQVRTAKPILIYWCQAAAMAIAGPTVFAARLPSAIAMVLTVGLVAVAVGWGVGWRRGLWTAFILATSGLAIAAAKLCITDALLLLWLTIAQICLYAIYSGSRSRQTIITMWLAIGLSGLTKGPVALPVMLSTVAILAVLDVGGQWRSAAAWRQAITWWRCTRPLMGVLIAAAVVAPWLVAIHLREPGFLRQTLTHDVVRRSLEPLEGHRGPPGFYLLSVWGTYLPWSLLLPSMVPLAWPNRRLAPVRFAIAAMIGPWLTMECVQTKLVHYILPAFPAMAFLTGDTIVRCIRGQSPALVTPLFRIGVAGWATIIAAIGTAPLLAAVLWEPRSGPSQIAGGVLAAMGIAYALTVLMAFGARRLASATVAMGVGMMFIVGVFYGFYLPHAQFLWLPQRIADSLARHDAAREHPAAMIDFREDSLLFYQGGTIVPQDAARLVHQPLGQWPQWIVLTRSAWNRLPWLATSQLQIHGSLHGLHYAGSGKYIEVLITGKRNPAPIEAPGR